MSVKEYMQQDKYDYTWKRDKGDGSYRGYLDRIKVDKDEGYEVKEFIEEFIKKHNLDTTKSNVRAIEDALHLPKYSDVVSREKLMQSLAKDFDL